MKAPVESIVKVPFDTSTNNVANKVSLSTSESFDNTPNESAIVRVVFFNIP